MKIGMIGLGRMGGNIARRIMRAGHQSVVFDRDEAAVQKLVGDGAEGADHLVAAHAGQARQVRKRRVVGRLLAQQFQGR